MNMIVVVMSIGTFILAQRIPDRIVVGRNRMNDPFFNERLESSVHCDPVDLFASFFLDVGMRKSAIAAEKQSQYSFPGTGYAKLISLQYFIERSFHGVIC
jgi:hypothetical protein